MNDEVTMTIDGRPVNPDHWFDVEDPATAQVFARAPGASPEQLDRAVRSAAAAFGPWAATDPRERAQRLRRCGEVLAAHQPEIAGLLSREQGKPIAQAEAEVALAAGWFADTAALPPGDEVLVDDDTAWIRLEREPHGVVAAITPFNYPVILSVCKIAPALLAGNTVVLKPSPATPLSTLRMGALLARELPPGVLNTVGDPGGLGSVLSRHPEVALVSFTGSVEVGRAIARDAAAELRPVVLELGGNDPAVVLPGADLEFVATALFALSTINSGQFCAAVKRIYVHRPQLAELTGLLADLATAARVGPGHERDSLLGPVTSRSQLERISGLVDEAVGAGARVVAGGARLGRPGHFYPPTVVTDLPAGSRLETEEQFGPVMPVLAYDHPAQAVQAGNATAFGLGASVWGDPEEALELAGGLRAGTVWINTHADLRHDVPFGGRKASGIGVEYGYWGLLEYSRIKVLNASRRAGPG